MGIGAEEKKPLLVQLDGEYYDIADFASKHPGGAKVIVFELEFSKERSWRCE